MKIYDFGHGSIKVFNDQATIQLSEHLSTQWEEKDVDELKVIYSQYLDTLPLDQVHKENGRVTLMYEIPSEFMNLEQLKNQPLPVRMAAIQQVLEQEPLKRKHYISLHPSTIFFRPMTHIRYGYLASSKTPKEKDYTDVEKYKSLAYSLLSGQSYESFLRHGVNAYQKKKTFYSRPDPEQVIKLMKTIAQAETLSELKEDVQDCFEYTQYQYFQDMTSLQQQFKHRLYAVLTSAFVVLLIGVLGTFLLTTNESQATAQQYEQELEYKNLTIQTLRSAKNQDYQEAITFMKEQGQSNQEIARFLVEEEQYQWALDIRPKSLESVVTTLYEKGQKEQLLRLKLKDNQRLADEKAIVSYDPKILNHRKNFIEDPELAHRMGVAFIKHQEVAAAEYLAEKFDDEKLIQRIGAQIQVEKNNE